jgi:hypothetical protein
VLGALPFAWRRLGTELRVILGGLAAAGLVVAVALAFAIFGVVQRYEADFVTLLLVAALGTWLWLARSARTAGRRRAIRRVGAVALAYGGVIAAATSLNGAGPWLKDARPGTFDALERFFGFVPSVYAAVTGSPHVVAVDHAASIRPAGITRLTLDGAEFLLGKNGATVQVASPSAGPAVLVARVQPLTPWTFRSQLAIRARASPGGSSAVVGFAQPRTGEIPVQLARGLNDITLEAVGQPPLRGLATDPDANTILHVLSLKVRKG